MLKPKILVTRRWPAAVEARLAERFDTVLNRSDVPMTLPDLKAALKTFDAVLPTVTDLIGAEALNVAVPRTRILANYGVGYSHIDIARVSELGITVTNTPDVLSECTADLAMMLLLMVARNAGSGEREIRGGRWTGWRPTHLLGKKVSGKTLGIIGFGRIGRAVAHRAHHGFGMKILVQNRSAVTAEILGQCNATQVESIEALMPRCDFISLHCPGGPENRNLIDERRLNLMKPDGYLINTARGEVIDEMALSQVLRSKRIGGAALDVFDGEPSINPVLKDCDNLVMLPHLGSATKESREAMGFRVFDNLCDFFEGRIPRDRVN